MKIELNNITKKYKTKYALKNVSIDLEEGVYGLLGTNGAGKTTLINIFMGILCSDQGDIIINGKNARVLGNDFLGHIGYLPQYPQFYKHFSVLEFLRYMCVVKDVDKADADNRINELLSKVNLTDAINKKIGALSGGMRQRLGIAQAMLNNPDILILDEPTAGLDPQERIRFRNLIAEFSDHRMILLATHIVTDVEFIANEVILLKDGHLIKQGKPKELEDEIHGHVWGMTINERSFGDDLNRYLISNMIREKDGIHLRIVSDEKPNETAIKENATLEDVFLYYCGEES